MIRFVADSQEVDETMRAEFHRHMTEGYDDLLRNLEARRKKQKHTENNTKSYDNSVQKLKEYGTTGPVGKKKKRIKSLGYI